MYYLTVIMKALSLCLYILIQWDKKKRNTALNQTEETWLKGREFELEWFSGLSEAESMFYISTTGALSFKIKLHWDDRQTLEYIQNLLSGLVNREVGVIVD